MMAMCLEVTGNINLIKEWALSLSDPYDRNNGGETEADNLGQTLFILSFFTDRNHPLVAKILKESRKYEVTDILMVNILEDVLTLMRYLYIRPNG